MDYILSNPLNQTISLFSFTETDSKTGSGTYAKTEIKGFVFIDRKRVKTDDSEEYKDVTCILIKNSIGRDAKILPEVTVETAVANTNAQIIASISNIVNHNGVIEGYEVVLL